MYIYQTLIRILVLSSCRTNVLVKCFRVPVMHVACGDLNELNFYFIR